MCCRCLLKHLYLHISALQRQPCLLKTNSTQALFGDVVDYITVQFLILDNFSTNGAVPDRTSRPQMLWAGLSLSGTQANSCIKILRTLCNRTPHPPPPLTLLVFALQDQ